MCKNNSPTELQLSIEKIEQLLQQLMERVEQLLQQRLKEPDYLTPAVLNDKYGISYTTFQRWKRNGLMQVYRIPGTGKLYVKESEILELLQKGKI